MRKLILTILPLVIASFSLHAGAPKPRLNTFEAKITAVGKDSVTVQTGRNAGLKVTGADPDKATQDSGPSNIKTYKITTFTAITVNGLKSDASALKTGMIVDVKQGADPSTAASIDASVAAPTPPPAASPAKPAGGAKGGMKMKKAFKPIVSNVVVAVSPDSIVIARPGGRKSNAYKISQFTVVTVNNEKSDVAHVKVGMEVTITAGTDPSVAAKIDADDAK